MFSAVVNYCKIVCVTMNTLERPSYQLTPLQSLTTFNLYYFILEVFPLV